MKNCLIVHRDSVMQSAVSREVSLHVRKVESKKIYKRAAMRQQVRRAW